MTYHFFGGVGGSGGAGRRLRFQRNQDVEEELRLFDLRRDVRVGMLAKRLRIVLRQPIRLLITLQVYSV